MPQKDERPRSRFWDFWTSLGGVLTGVAAVIAAVGTLAALFVGSDDTERPAPSTRVGTESKAGDGGGDKRALEDSGIVRLQLAGAFYDLTTINWGSTIRVHFVSVVP